MDSSPREFPRYAVNAEVTITREGEICKGTTRNVSKGGLCADVQAACEIGAKVELALALVFDRDTFSEPLALSARVVWCTPMADHFQVGLAFVGLSDEELADLDLIVRYLAEAG